MAFAYLIPLLTLIRRRRLAHALLDNWWVDHPQRPGESVLTELHAEIDRLFQKDLSAEPDHAFRQVTSKHTPHDG